jgi:hypothetical protein
MLGMIVEKLEKLRKLVADMKTSIYPDCNEKWTKLFASLNLLHCGMFLL